MNSSELRIGEVAIRVGVSIDAVRYYERRRLLPAAPRTEGGFRLFTPDTVKRVRFIQTFLRRIWGGKNRNELLRRIKHD